MGNGDDELDLAALDDADLVPQMHDDLYDGLADEVVEGDRKSVVRERV